MSELCYFKSGHSSKSDLNSGYFQFRAIFQGMSTDLVYSTIANRKEDTVSQTVCGPKMIDNPKLASKKTVENNKQDLRSEAEVLVSSLQTVPMFNSVMFNKDQYVSVNLLPNMLNDLYTFCVVGNSILRIDTTFELVNGL